VLVSTSAVGYYGDTGAREVDEHSPPGTDFLAALSSDWEAAALRAEAHGTRVCVVRIGLVLGRGGGVLGTMLPPFRLGLGGPIGSGEQYFPWVHLDDLVGMRSRRSSARTAGPLLAVAPGIVTNREFAAALGRALHRPAVLRVPGLRPAPRARRVGGGAARRPAGGPAADPGARTSLFPSSARPSPTRLSGGKALRAELV
jgi:uncharacterized protein (TIGR01777 family)